MNAPTTLTQLRQSSTALVAAEPDYGVDLFSVRGLKLALRIAEFFAQSDAVPAMFRSHTLKRVKGQQDIWIENPSAMGNCLVAIETARAIGMSITSVMQNANIIEGKLSWAAQFWIAAINASARFTPLRFDIQNRGMIKAKYREKLGWNKDKNGFDFAEREVELEDLVCIAWALPHGFVLPKGIYTLKQARAADLPTIESAPVSMKLAVEEGWYSKPGSKWQTEMKHQMLQYRAGAFFGRIHAPDIVMGMGRTSEELSDTSTTVDVAADGTVTPVTNEQLQCANRAAMDKPAEVVQRIDSGLAEPAADDATEATGSVASTADHIQTFDANAFAARMEKCTSIDALDLMGDQIRQLADKDMAATLHSIYMRLRSNQVAPGSDEQSAAPARRTRPARAPE